MENLISPPMMMFSKVMHHRLIPADNKFFYNMFYFVLSADYLFKKSRVGCLGFNKVGLFSIQAKDYGDKNQNTPLDTWLQNLLDIVNIPDIHFKDVKLITLPRVLGYVFNPVSFWLCLDGEQKLRAVICEVNNTFGERHVYICVHHDRREILESDVMIAEKVFHVSPFIKRDGHYQFKFGFNRQNFSATIDYYTGDNQKMLLTSVKGRLVAADGNSVLKAFFSYPLITLKTIFLIHLQAIKIILKGIKYIPKPVQHSITTTQSSEII
jgi:uncharacterized protein